MGSGGAEAEDCILSVVMLPWLAHGHVSPFLELAKRLCGHRVLVHLCSTPVNLVSVREHLDEGTFPSLRLVELHLPALPGLPPRLHTTRRLPPHLMATLKQAFDLSEPAFARLLLALRPAPDLLLYDFIQPWAPLAAARHLGIPAVQFLTTGAASTALFLHHLRNLRRQQQEEFPFHAMRFQPPPSPDDPKHYAGLLKRVSNGVSDGDRLVQCLDRSCGFVAIKSFREIEDKYVDYLASLAGKEIVPVGPLVLEDAEPVGHEERRLVEWLDGRARSSVVFVSFGSEYVVSAEETEEVARGLELSGASFLWVVHLLNKKKRQDELGRTSTSGESDAETDSDGDSGGSLLERIRRTRASAGEGGGGGSGVVVEGWAPQRLILAHPSLGGFLTHCGWSSVMEGMSFGVPLIALPMQLDQPMNARLVVELGVGVEVKRDEGGFGGFTGEEVAKAVSEVLGDASGEGVRRKAKDMADAMARNKGDREIRVMVEKMGALCGKKDTWSSAGKID